MDINDSKEILTPIIIKKELLKLVTHNFPLLFIKYLAIGFFFWTFAWFFHHAPFYHILTIIFIVIISFAFYMILCTIYILSLKLIKNDLQ